MMGIGPIVPDFGGHLSDEKYVPGGRRLGGSTGEILLADDATATGSLDALLIPSIGAALFGEHGLGAPFELSFVFGDGVGSVVACYLDEVVGVGVTSCGGEDGREGLEGVFAG